MLLANGCAAKLAREQGLPFIYRIHEQPAPDRLNNLCEFLGVMGVNAAGLRQDASRDALAAVLDSVRGQEVEQVVNTVRPCILASWTAMPPTAPEPPWINAVCTLLRFGLRLIVW